MALRLRLFNSTASHMCKREIKRSTQVIRSHPSQIPLGFLRPVLTMPRRLLCKAAPLVILYLHLFWAYLAS